MNQQWITKILRVAWNPGKDTLQVTLNPWNKGDLTKRMILRFVASHYDPMGFLVPVMIQFKLFLQNLRKKNSTWNQVISEENKEIRNSLLLVNFILINKRMANKNKGSTKVRKPLFRKNTTLQTLQMWHVQQLYMYEVMEFKRSELSYYLQNQELCRLKAQQYADWSC